MSRDPCDTCECRECGHEYDAAEIAHYADTVEGQRDSARRFAKAWKALAKGYREVARYACEKESLGANVRNFMLYTRALKHITELAGALAGIEPFLPTLDDGPCRHSAHARAAGRVRLALDALRKGE